MRRCQTRAGRRERLEPVSEAGGVPETPKGKLARVAAGMAAMTLLMTRPLFWQATGALPGNLGDPLLNTFILGWDADRILHGFVGLWSAPFYFPLRDTLAFSEHLLGVALFTSPVIWLTGNPVLAYNLAFLGSYVLAGVGMYLLAARLWGRSDAAWLAALAFAFAPHRVMYVPYLQVLMSGWMPLSLWGLHGNFASGSRRSLAVFAGAFALLGLSNGYFLYFFTVPVAVVAGGSLLRRANPRWRPVRGTAWKRDSAHLAAAALAILAVIAPVALAYVRVRQCLGLHRSVSEMEDFAARWSDYVRIPASLPLWSRILRVGDLERMLFPGLTCVVLAAIALLSVRRSMWTRGVVRPALWTWHVGLYATVLGLSLWLSAGPAAPGPYQLLLRVVPGFDGLRAPARIVVVVSLALAVLGSAGAAWLLSRLRPRLARITAVMLGAAIVLEGYQGPMAMKPFSADQPVRRELNEWLRGRPAGGVLELPIWGPNAVPATLVYQYNTLIHHHPVVNGYSGYGYGLQDFLGGPDTPFREPEAMADLLLGLRTIGVRYLVVHRGAQSRPPGFWWPDFDVLVAAIDAASGQGHEGRRFNDAIAWELDGPPARTPVEDGALVRLPGSAFAATASVNADHLRYAFDGDVKTNWVTAAPQAGGEWIRLSFGRDVDVGRLVVLTSSLGLTDYPRGLTVESEAKDGSRHTLFSGPFLPFLVAGIAGNRPGSPSDVDLPRNLSRAVWLRQAGSSSTCHWGVHELQVYERRVPR
jgi:hypothetical protein